MKGKKVVDFSGAHQALVTEGYDYALIPINDHPLTEAYYVVCSSTAVKTNEPPALGFRERLVREFVDAFGFPAKAKCYQVIGDSNTIALSMNLSAARSFHQSA